MVVGNTQASLKRDLREQSRSRDLAGQVDVLIHIRLAEYDLDSTRRKTTSPLSQRRQAIFRPLKRPSQRVGLP
jgi:hypothetical protein